MLRHPATRLLPTPQQLAWVDPLEETPTPALLSRALVWVSQSLPLAVLRPTQPLCSSLRAGTRRNDRVINDPAPYPRRDLSLVLSGCPVLVALDRELHVVTAAAEAAEQAVTDAAYEQRRFPPPSWLKTPWAGTKFLLRKMVCIAFERATCRALYHTPFSMSA